MANIDRSQVSETGDFRFCVEASTLRWAPGYFPDEVTTNLGNGLNLVKSELKDDGGVVYKQVAGCISVRVFND